MSDPQQYGLVQGLAVAAPEPLRGVAFEAAHCWHWCQGWRPDLWPAYAALHPVSDWCALAEALEVIRDPTRPDHDDRETAVPADGG